MAKVEDDFLYPLPVGPNVVPPASSGKEPEDGGGGLRLTNAFNAILSLYTHAGAIPKQRFNKDADDSSGKKEGGGDADTNTSPSSGNTTKKKIVCKMDPEIKDKWFKYTERVIPGGVMRLVESITYPTPKGWTTTTAARVNQLFDRRYLVEFEPKEILAQFTYTELDELRFAYTAIFDLITGGVEAISKTQVSAAVAAAYGVASSSSSSSAAASASSASAAASPPSFYAAQTAQAAVNSKVFEGIDGGWPLQGLAKRDIKKNCDPTAASSSAMDGASSSASASAASNTNNNGSSAPPVVVAGKQKAGVAKGGTGSSGLVRTDASKERPKLAAEKKHAKALLEDECVKLWPYTPFAKSAVFTLSQDPNQPRHKPLYKAVVELTAMNKRKVEGPWMGNKKDAEDAAAEVVLKFLYTSSFGKK